MRYGLYLIERSGITCYITWIAVDVTGFQRRISDTAVYSLSRRTYIHWNESLNKDEGHSIGYRIDLGGCIVDIYILSH